MPEEHIHEAASIRKLGHHEPLVQRQVPLCGGNCEILPARGALRLVVDRTPAGVALALRLAASRRLPVVSSRSREPRNSVAPSMTCTGEGQAGRQHAQHSWQWVVGSWQLTVAQLTVGSW